MWKLFSIFLAQNFSFSMHIKILWSSPNIFSCNFSWGENVQLGFKFCSRWNVSGIFKLNIAIDYVDRFNSMYSSGQNKKIPTHDIKKHQHADTQTQTHITRQLPDVWYIISTLQHYISRFFLFLNDYTKTFVQDILRRYQHGDTE